MADTKIWDGTSWRAGETAHVWDGTQWVPLTSGEAGGSGGACCWTRPADWLPTTVVGGEQKIQLLVAVWPNFGVTGRQVLFKVSGAYTVDWGDGTAPQNFAFNTEAKHEYAANVLAGTETSEGWRQALVTITPQAGGSTLTDFTIPPTPYDTGKNFSSPVMEVVLGAPTVTSFAINSSTGGATPTIPTRRVEFLAPVTLSSMAFKNAHTLKEVIGDITYTGTTMLETFMQCYDLERVRDIRSTTVTSMDSTFKTCYSVRDVDWPEFDSSKVTNFSSTFMNATSLSTVPTWFNTSGALTLNSVFTGTAITTFPWMDLSKATTIASPFSGYQMIEIQGELDVSAANSFTMFAVNNTALRKVAFAAGKGPKVTFTLYGMLDGPTLNAIYTSLPTVSAKTITVTSNPGALGDDPTIATAKGWTVTGS